MTDEDAKIIAVPHASLTSEYNHINDVDQLPDLLKAQISQFFERYKELEPNKWVKIAGWGILTTLVKRYSLVITD